MNEKIINNQDTVLNFDNRPPLRPLTESDRELCQEVDQAALGRRNDCRSGQIYQPEMLSGILAFRGTELIGLITYHIMDCACEIVTMNSFEKFQGIGTALLDAVKSTAAQAGCRRLWLVTTNDNLDALRFYQRRGLRLAVLHRDAVTISRQMKPEIPLLGEYNIPILDEIELEIRLD